MTSFSRLVATVEIGYGNVPYKLCVLNTRTLALMGVCPLISLLFCYEQADILRQADRPPTGIYHMPEGCIVSELFLNARGTEDLISES
jgi:hypothetical protein